MVWRTSDGNPPQSELIVEIIRQSVAPSAVITIKFIAVLIFIAICLTIFLLVKWRNCQGVEDSFKRMTFGTFLGSLFGLVAVFAYPHSDGNGWNMEQFCKLAPALVAFSLILVTTCMAVKILLKFVCQHQKSSIKKNPKLKTNSTITMLIVLAIILALVIVNATGPNTIRSKVIQHSTAKISDQSEIVSKLTLTEFETCDTPNFLVGWIFLTLDLIIALSTILASISLRKRISGPYMSDFELSTNLFYLLFPIVFVLFLILVIFNGKMVQFVVLVFFSFFQSFVLLGGFWWWKLGNRFTQQEAICENGKHGKFVKLGKIRHKNSKLAKKTYNAGNQKVLEIPPVSKPF